MKKIFLFGLMALALACGKTKKDEASKEADKSNKSSVDDIAAEAGLKFKCDGEGDSFTGKYTFKVTSLKAKCSLLKDEIEIPESETIFSCTQKDKDFTCNSTLEKANTLSGCISKDGKFKISITADNQFFSKEKIDLQGNDVNSKGFMVGIVNQAGGVIQYSIVAKKDGKENSCIMKGNLETQETNE